jgi:hypothetical protein
VSGQNIALARSGDSRDFGVQHEVEVDRTICRSCGPPNHFDIMAREFAAVRDTIEVGVKSSREVEK